MLQSESDVSPFFLTFVRKAGHPGKMGAVPDVNLGEASRTGLSLQSWAD